YAPAVNTPARDFKPFKIVGPSWEQQQKGPFTPPSAATLEEQAATKKKAQDDAQQLVTQGRSLYNEGKYHEAAKTLRWAIVAVTINFGVGSEEEADCLSHLGFAEYSAGDPASAEPRMRECVEYWTRVKGADDPKTIDCLTMHGAILYGRDDYAAS